MDWSGPHESLAEIGLDAPINYHFIHLNCVVYTQGGENERGERARLGDDRPSACRSHHLYLKGALGTRAGIFVRQNGRGRRGRMGDGHPCSRQVPSRGDRAMRIWLSCGAAIYRCRGSVRCVICRRPAHISAVLHGAARHPRCRRSGTSREIWSVETAARSSRRLRMRERRALHFAWTGTRMSRIDISCTRTFRRARRRIRRRRAQWRKQRVPRAAHRRCR